MIITSLLDTDLYKFTMMQVVLHQFPGAQVEYRFRCRNPGINLAAHASEIRDEIRSLCSLHFQDAELAYLRTLRFIKSDFVDFLGLFRLNEKYITVTTLPSGEIDITIRGPWLHTILFEIPVLAIVNEVWFRNSTPVPDFVEGRKRLDHKIALLQAQGLHDLKIADYGTRRRFSKAWHEEVLRVLIARLHTGVTGQFAGTSNVLFAMKLGLTPLGTMAHEYLQAHQAFGCRLRDFQRLALENWVMEYRGDLGIAPLLLLVRGSQLGELESRHELFEDFCVTPFHPMEFEARLKHLLTRQGVLADDSETIVYKALVLNLETYQASIDDDPLDLTYMEYELLKFLAQNPGRVFTRETLLSRVWGYEYYGGARTVDVHIRRLRAKLGEQHAQMISTVRSVGYRFGESRWG